MNSRPCLGLITVLLALGVAGGCGKQPESKQATQVEAKVNADEITVHQVNRVLARSQNVTPELAGPAKRAILDKLIEQTLARQQALNKKLDRSPAVMQAVEAARSEILARAYLEQIAAAQPAPTAAEVKQYYAAHPELFAQRRIFNLEDLVVLPSEGLAAALREEVAKARSLAQISAWLKSRDAKFTANRGVLAAEQIPLELLPALQAMKDGDIQLVESGGRLQVIRLIASQAAPLDEATAIPRIQQFLFNQRSIEAIAREMKQLKQAAHIEYVGELGNELAEADTRPEATTALPVAPDASPATPLPASNLDKGVRGLLR
jgi:EpsD family peptidyl-prolyl cis-trans isomerase